MDGRIGQLHCTYRIFGEPTSARGLVSRLELRAAEDLERACSDALEQAIGDDPAVYVLRRVNSRLVLGADEDTEDQRIRRWGERLAGAVVRTIAYDAGDAQNLVRFEDQADFVARFVIDTLDGVAWDRWYFGAFSSLKPCSRQDTLRRALLDNEGHLDAILAALMRRRSLDRLLAALDADTVSLIWGRVRRLGGSSDGTGERPLFALAVEIVDRLQLWRHSRPDIEAMFRDYVAGGPALSDWRSRSGLADGVMQAVNFLAGRSLLRSPDAKESGLLAAIDGAVRRADWLDGDRLIDRLQRVLVATEPRIDLPVRPAACGITQRQRALLALLARIVRETDVALDRLSPDSEANALRLYALVVAEEPSWAGDPVAVDLIGMTMAAWAASFRRAGAPIGTDRSRVAEPVDGGLAEAPIAARAIDDLDRQFEALAPEAAEVIAALMAGGASQELQWVDTECAAAFLLVRPYLDLRLPNLASSAGFATEQAWQTLLVSLGLKLFGQAGIREGVIDSGLLTMAGCDEPMPLHDLSEFWSDSSGNAKRLERLLLDRAIGFRLADSSARSLDKLKHARPGEASETFGFRIPGCDAETDALLGRIAACIVRAWAFWLPRFAQSSLPYLMSNFLVRGGRFAASSEEITVELDSLPLDEILRMARYLDEIDNVSWLANRRLAFRIRGR